MAMAPMRWRRHKGEQAQFLLRPHHAGARRCSRRLGGVPCIDPGPVLRRLCCALLRSRGCPCALLPLRAQPLPDNVPALARYAAAAAAPSVSLRLLLLRRPAAVAPPALCPASLGQCVRRGLHVDHQRNRNHARHIVACFQDSSWRPCATRTPKIRAVNAIPPATRSVPQPTAHRCRRKRIPFEPCGISRTSSARTDLVDGAGSLKFPANCTLRAKLSGAETVVATPAATKSAANWT